ncbi:MAG: PLDc N-terminal domain-containing protein [Candidatus Omnitrophica bacterium]|nr:PLDc N-terminal domain-containing protein [Candidatus Omnitrophota bacterium]
MGGILGIVILVLDVLAILNLFKSAKPTGQKILWTVLILILPVIGLILYYLLGRK